MTGVRLALSWLTVLASQTSRTSRLALSVVAIGISISTVFVKQHYVVDVLAGATLAWAAWQLAGMTPLYKSKCETTPAGLAITSAAE